MHAWDLFPPHLKDQFAHQSVPVTVGLQAAVFVVGSDVDLVFKAQVAGERVQDVDGEALVLFRLSQNILWHHYKRLLLQGKDKSSVSARPIDAPVIQALNHQITQEAVTPPQMLIWEVGGMSARANVMTTVQSGHAQNVLIHNTGVILSMFTTFITRQKRCNNNNVVRHNIIFSFPLELYIYIFFYTWMIEKIS